MLVSGPPLSAVVDVLTRAVVAGSGIVGTAALLLFVPVYALRLLTAVLIVGAAVLALMVLQSVLITLFALAGLLALASLPVSVERTTSKALEQ
ncbi:hypothetical protein [Halapricum desulfuricans]|uniref:Uncharacterized protein n=1 Tax=Halapricum desulfuricans TaxID=2841257 RepID=A0A897N1U6_9EURY|nr:hypothetical protein [Halapricum desulfuricans]QSG05069.1 hypothetical protein HSR121_0715 [Halapricum desulfuricans]